MLIHNDLTVGRIHVCADHWSAASRTGLNEMSIPLMSGNQIRHYQPKAGRRGKGSPSRGLACALVAGLILTFSVVSTSHADESPAGFIRSLGDQVISVVRDKTVNQAERKKALHAIFIKNFDVTGISRFVLGPYWRSATDVQRADFMRLFPDYVTNIYADQFANYSGETFVVTAVHHMRADRFMVSAEIRGPDGPKIPVNFQVRRSPGGFKIEDVEVEGVSQVLTNRDEIGSLIMRKGMDSLISRLRRQVGVPAASAS